MRRMIGASALLVTGLVSSWELLQNLNANGSNGTAGSATAIEPILPPPSPTTVSETVSETVSDTVTDEQTVTEQQTVTVTEETVTSTKYVNGPSTQQSSTQSPSQSSTQQSSTQSPSQSSTQQSSTQSPTQSSTQQSSTQQSSTQQSSTQQSSTQQSSTSSQTSTQQSSTSTASSTSTGTPAGYVLVAAMSSLAGKTSAYFTHPTGGLSLLVNVGGQWYAGSATCTHQPCTVKWQSPDIYCPCHDGYYNPTTGAVLKGPPPKALHQYGVLIQNNNLYVTAT